MSSKPKRPVLPTDAIGELTLMYPYSEEEYRNRSTQERKSCWHKLCRSTSETAK